MNVKQAAGRLTKLGFTMNPAGADCSRFGTMTPEPFTTEFHIHSTPFRDVFFAKCKGGWYVTSHIKFKARRYRARMYNTFECHTKNIFGSGDTLLKAITEFETNFKAKQYNVQ
jgi:hypothetical protein